MSGYWIEDDSDSGKMKEWLRAEHRVKHGTDYAMVLKRGEVHVLTGDTWVSRIEEGAEKFGINITSVSIIK
jgi:hypothetical protein